MEKIYIKPVSKELITKSTRATGHSDIFSYHPESGEDAKKLGSLFIVGHVQHASDDVAYMINLVAALAKREYYAKAALAPREAFANTLRKINEVVEEFFKNRELAVDIGVFIIAGEQIYISRLGKFKIILARDEKNIDILNNIEFFEKEHIQEKEFSNIISGKMLAGDRILAFYPGQPVVSRERFIKAHFLNLSESEFIRKINDIKTANEQFSCALLYIHLNRVKETAKAPQIQPSELLEVSLASQTPAPARTRKPAPLEPNEDAKGPEATLAAVERPVVQNIPDKSELPRIIPSEFSLGRRVNPVMSALKGFRLLNFSFNFKNKIFLSLCAVVVIIGAALAVKSIFIVDPEARKLKSALGSLKTGIVAAQTKVSQNDPAGARATILESITVLRNIPAGDKRSALSAQLFSLLDGIDQAQDTSPSLVWQMPAELGTAKLVAAYDAGLFVYSTDASGNGTLEVIENNAVKSRWDAGSVKPSALVNNDGSPALVDMAARTIATPKDDKLRTTTWADVPGTTAANLYQDNLYILASGTIFKIPDAAKSNGKPAQWLKAGSSVPADAMAIIVDGNIFVLSKSGTLTTYYKGAKTLEAHTPVPPTDKSLLMTSQDSLFLYMVDTELNRVYVLNKKDGALAKTYKIGTAEPIVSAAVGADDSIYFITSDNKVWKIK